MNNDKNLEIVAISKVFDKDFTIYGTIDNPLFLAKDVAEWIEYDTAQVGKMIQTVDDDEKLPVKLLRAGQMREMWFLTENGLYEVLMQSRKPIAKSFKKEVKAILHQIRTKGGYITEKGVENILDNPLYIMELVNSSARKILEMKKEIEEKDMVIEVQKPKVEFYDTVTKSESTFDMAEVAKLLKIPNMGSVKLFEFLREQDVLSDNKANWNEPYQNYVNSGYFKIVETKNEDKHRNVHANKKTVVFQKGLDFIRKLAKDNGLIKTNSIALF